MSKLTSVDVMTHKQYLDRVSEILEEYREISFVPKPFIHDAKKLEIEFENNHKLELEKATQALTSLIEDIHKSAIGEEVGHKELLGMPVYEQGIIVGENQLRQTINQASKAILRNEP